MKSLVSTLRPWALAVAIIAMAIPSLGQEAGKPGMPDPQQQPQAQPQTESPQTSADSQIMETFEGTIARLEGSYVLKDSTGATYQLDDQKRAKDFSGQNVRVTGALDSSTNTIHVASIRPAS